MPYLLSHQHYLAYNYLASDNPTPKGIVLIVPGLSMLRGHYIYLSHTLLAMGYHVYVYDPRHFGQSSGQPKNHLDLAGQVQDIKTFTAYIKAQHPYLPLIIWGQSLGASITLLANPAAAHWILQTPYLDGQTSLKHLPKKRFEYKKNILLAKPNGGGLFQDPKAYPFFKKNPNWQNSLTATSLKSLYQLSVLDKQPSTPITILAARQDAITPIALCHTWQSKLKQANLIELPGGHFDEYGIYQSIKSFFSASQLNV
jgi:pimeloyl-ACP methyl ester carboxylesterase